MGVRPKIMTVFGIDNFTGEIDEDGFCGKSVYVSKDEVEKYPSTLGFVKDLCFDHVEKDWKWYPDVLYFGRYNDEGQSIAGLKLSYNFEGKTIRTLAMLYPWFMQSGYRDIPLEPLDEQILRMQLTREIPSCGDIEFRDKWFYPQGYWKLAPQWAFVTRWLFDSVGIETNVDDYKWMLVWEWS